MPRYERASFLYHVFIFSNPTMIIFLTNRSRAGKGPQGSSWSLPRHRTCCFSSSDINSFFDHVWWNDIHHAPLSPCLVSTFLSSLFHVFVCCNEFGKWSCIKQGMSEQHPTSMITAFPPDSELHSVHLITKAMGWTATYWRVFFSCENYEIKGSVWLWRELFVWPCSFTGSRGSESWSVYRTTSAASPSSATRLRSVPPALEDLPADSAESVSPLVNL
jgi:hypothetical protein